MNELLLVVTIAGQRLRDPPSATGPAEGGSAGGAAGAMPARPEPSHSCLQAIASTTWESRADFGRPAAPVIAAGRRAQCQCGKDQPQVSAPQLALKSTAGAFCAPAAASNGTLGFAP